MKINKMVLLKLLNLLGLSLGLHPVTNPTSTTLFKAIIAIKTRNPIIFAFHPSAQKCSAEAARVVYEAAIKQVHRSTVFSGSKNLQSKLPNN